MKIYFDEDSLKSREKTELKDKEGNLLYWGIYDFSFKHRTRIFDVNNNEIAYVQKDISKDYCLINFCDSEDKLLGYMQDDVVNPKQWKLEGNEIKDVMKIYDDYMETYDENNLLECICVLFALIEKER